MQEKMKGSLIASLLMLAFSAQHLASAPKSLIAEAAMQGNHATLRELLKQDADVNGTLPDGTTALHWAVRSDDLEALDLLLRAKANPNLADPDGVTPLSLACANANIKAIQKLIAAGANVNFADPAGETALMIAARIGNVDVIKALLDAGAAINARDAMAQQSALMVAVRDNHAPAVRLLLDRGAEVDAATRVGKTPARRPPGAGGGSHGVGIVRSGWPDRGYQEATPGGMTPLLYAARDGRLEIARLLLDKGAAVNLTDANKITPLMMAIANDKMDVAGYLLDHGADINAADFWGRTPLWAAVEMRNLELNKSGQNGVDRERAFGVIKALLDRGANPNARTAEVPPTRRFIMGLGDLSWVDFTGQTPFLRAALSGDVTVMRLLLSKGADPNIPTFAGTTALLAAAGVNWVPDQTYTEGKEALLDAIKLCLEKGADINAVNSMGIGAVIGAANRGSDEILQFLVDHGAKLDVKDKEGRTPLVWAEGVFLATNAPQQKPSTMALIKHLQAKPQ